MKSPRWERTLVGSWGTPGDTGGAATSTGSQNTDSSAPLVILWQLCLQRVSGEFAQSCLPSRASPGVCWRQAVPAAARSTAGHRVAAVSTPPMSLTSQWRFTPGLSFSFPSLWHLLFLSCLFLPLPLGCCKLPLSISQSADKVGSDSFFLIFWSIYGFTGSWSSYFTIFDEVSQEFLLIPRKSQPSDFSTAGSPYPWGLSTLHFHPCAPCPASAPPVSQGPALPPLIYNILPFLYREAQLSQVLIPACTPSASLI